MTQMEVTVTGTHCSVQVTGSLTSGMVGVPVSFVFDEEWTNLTKTAVFRAGDKVRDRVDVQTQTTVPWEVLQKKNCTLHVGVYGVNDKGTLVIPTVWAEAGLIQPGTDPAGDEGTDPSLPVWQQLLNENKRQAKQIQQLENPTPKELPMSWELLAAKIKTGDFTGINVGDYKPVTFRKTGSSYYIRANAYVMGIDTYYGIGNHGERVGHHIDFGIFSPYFDGRMNDADTNNGTAAEPNPWRASKAFEILNTEKHPDGWFDWNVAPYIIEKFAQLDKRYSTAGKVTNTTGWDNNTFVSMGRFWIPNEVEVFGRKVSGETGFPSGGGGCNVQYPLFRNGLKHFCFSNCDAFWLCTPKANNSDSWCVVKTNGNATSYKAHSELCYPVCFRIG